MTEANKEFIDLQSCNATQHTTQGVNGDWHIKLNGTEEVIQILPGYIVDMDLFTILDFAKKYELIAFNAGINMQKTKQNIFLKASIKELENVNTELAEENVRLATILENLLPEV